QLHAGEVLLVLARLVEPLRLLLGAAEQGCPEPGADEENGDGGAERARADDACTAGCVAAARADGGNLSDRSAPRSSRCGQRCVVGGNKGRPGALTRLG